MSKRYLIVCPNRYNIGLDVGWRFVDPQGRTTFETMWGNTKSDATLTMLCVDLRSRGFDFSVIRETEADKMGLPRFLVRT